MKAEVSILLLFCLSMPIAPAAEGSSFEQIGDNGSCLMGRQVFDQLEAGMSVDAVTVLAGCEGEHAASYKTASGHTDIYNWDEEGSHFASLLFENGVLTIKRQRGLP